jgi:hypothetical protein
LVEQDLIIFPNTRPFDENQPKPAWYKDNEYCDYHRVRGHDTKKCMKFKNYVQDLIDSGKIEVEGHNQSSNSKLKIYSTPFPNHNQSNQNDHNINAVSTSNNNTTPYDYSTNSIMGFDSLCGNLDINDTCGFDSLCGHIEESDNSINTLTLKGADCNATTRRARVTVQAAPNQTNAPAAPSTANRPASRYDLISQLKKTPAQISILELLDTSPIHKEILEQALQGSRVPENINAAQFQAMIGNLAAQQHLVFTDKDFRGPDLHHNKPLHIEALIHRHKIK